MGIFGKRRSIVLLILFFTIPPLFSQSSPVTPSESSSGGKTTVVIEQARKTENRKDPETGNDTIYLSGDVILSVDDGKNKVSIFAEEIVFDRKREMVFAEGLDRMERISSDNSKEVLRGGSLLFNISSMEGIFQGGTIIQDDSPLSGSSSDTSVIVSSELFGRDRSGTVSFKKGILTFCEDPEPHWKIRASRIWLLPGNEFAFLNAVLFVGEIPVFYMPFFYYPKDEMIFNPVFGYRDREGYFVQTTYYFIGRKPEEKVDEESLLSLTSSGPAREQRREGLFLRNLEETLQSRPKNTLKLMADLYSNLGGMIGILGDFSPEKTVRKISFEFDIGLSRTLFPDSDVYVPYDSSGTMYWNSSSPFGIDLPFRFKADFNLDIAIDKLNLAIALPLWSDPFFYSDFLSERKETMDWLSYLTEGQKNEEEQLPAASTISSFAWKINGSFRPQIQLTAPWLSTTEITNFSSSITFSSRIVSGRYMSPELITDSPDRQFFFPSKVIPLSTDFQLAGTIFQYPKKTAAVAVNSLQGWDIFAPPDITGETSVPDQRDAVGTEEDALSPEEPVPEEAASPEAEEIVPENPYSLYEEELLAKLSPPVPSVPDLLGLVYNLKYTIKPSFASEMTYLSQNWNTVDDIEWDDYANSYYKISLPITMDSSFQWRGSFLSLNNSLQLNTVWAEHPTITEDYYSASVIKQMIANDYAARQTLMTLSNVFSFKPFILTDYFKPVAVNWNWKTKLFSTSFTGTADDPSWELLEPEWNEDTVESHTLSAVAGATILGYDQTFSLTTNLPPRVESYTGNIGLRFFFGSFTMNTGIKRETKDSKTWIKNPLNMSLSFFFFNKNLTADQSFVYYLEEDRPENYTASLRSSSIVSLKYIMRWTYPYTLSNAGWQAKPDQEFIPSTIELNLTSPKRTFYQWKNRVSLIPGLSTALVFDLIRPTESYFTFAPSVTFKINSFLELTFSSESRNDVIFRYVQKQMGFSPEIPGETNFFKDLWDSFTFWDEISRRNSGFKLNSLSFKLEHNLHDWVLQTELTIKPRLLTDKQPYRYDFSPYFSFGIAWKPFKGMKTTIVDEYGEFILNP
ncbi:MAG: hypothetical protein LBR47_00925 [Spirochaetaceae bacterium]|jgi:hypothetical protein|nr:hypothetical protein [Spirochaetaceae bacterium]